MAEIIRRDIMHVLLDLPPRVAVGPTEAKKLGISIGYVIHRGVPGYTPVPSMTDEIAARWNARITEAQIEAMQVGSMFGWHVPGADPLNCEADIKRVAERKGAVNG